LGSRYVIESASGFNRPISKIAFVDLYGNHIAFKGCNQNRASYQKQLNGTIKFGLFMSTRMFCPDSPD
jgi:heat shock protein HslJ